MPIYLKIGIWVMRIVVAALTLFLVAAGIGWASEPADIPYLEEATPQGVPSIPLKK